MEKKMETTIACWDYIGIMEKKMETPLVYWDYMGIMEKKMETPLVYWEYIWITEKKNGNYYLRSVKMKGYSWGTLQSMC